jgi:tetratricopeptide (TPR) repeat protein
VKDNSNISQELLEAIERYINGTMEAKELKDFNEYLLIDDEFKTQVEDIKIMLLGIETQSLKEQLNEFHKDIPENKTDNVNKIRFLSLRKIAVAAAIIIATGSFWFFNNPPNEKLYAKYFKPDPGLPTTMSSSDNFEFYDAMVHYKHGDYNVAIDKWSALNMKNPSNDSINYFLGVAHLANKNEEKAIPFLEKAVTNKQFTFLSDAYYYLGLSYLKDGNYIAAKKNLNLSDLDSSKSLLIELNK